MTKPPQRVTMEPPYFMVTETKVLLDGMRVPATRHDIQRLREAINEDIANGYTPPKEVAGLVL
jgi:hypothetical protein